jgi:hypothetical protein
MFANDDQFTSLAQPITTLGIDLGVSNDLNLVCGHGCANVIAELGARVDQAYSHALFQSIWEVKCNRPVSPGE